MQHETIFGLILIGLGAGIIGGFIGHTSYLANPAVKYVYPQTLQTYATEEKPTQIYTKPTQTHTDRPQLPTSSNQRSKIVEGQSGSIKRQIEEYVCSDKFKWDCARIRRIIFCESSYREKVVSRTGDVGVLQIAPVHNYSIAHLSDYRNNIDVGYTLFLARGYQPWYSSKKCWSKMK